MVLAFVMTLNMCQVVVLRQDSDRTKYSMEFYNYVNDVIKCAVPQCRMCTFAVTLYMRRCSNFSGSLYMQNASYFAGTLCTRSPSYFTNAILHIQSNTTYNVIVFIKLATSFSHTDHNQYTKTYVINVEILKMYLCMLKSYFVFYGIPYT